MVKPINADNYFAIIPEWVLYQAPSANAVRVYAVLQRFADKDSGQCYPSRKTLADRCLLSLSSLDRAISELIAMGALLKQSRKSDAGDYTSNIYTVITNAGVASKTTPPIVTGEGTGIVTGDEQTKVNMKQSQEQTASRRIAQIWWNDFKQRNGGKTPVGAKAWHALTGVIAVALKAGWNEQQVSQALQQCTTIPSAAMLDRELVKLPKIVQPAKKQCWRCKGSGVAVLFLPEGGVGEQTCDVCDGDGER